MNSGVEPPQKKKKTNPSLPSFLSLPDVIVLNCLACISRSYYPKLSLVCKTFKSLISSEELNIAKYHLGTGQPLFHVCLQLSDHHGLSWFSLWIKPNQTLTNDLEKKKKKNKSTGNTRLVPVPSSYVPYVPFFTVRVGSELYAFNRDNAPSSFMGIRNKGMCYWRKAPNMSVARQSALACVSNGKIYVMGGCGGNESANWAEVFDPKTQTWEPLPDPGVEIRSSKIKTLSSRYSGKIYVNSNELEKDYVYDLKEGKWDVAAKRYVKCVIEKVHYRCDEKNCLWYDTKRKEWRGVKGLAALNRNPRRGMMEIANYCGKLLILWDKFVHSGRCQDKYIWCAVIALEKRNDNEVWETLSGLMLCLQFLVHTCSCVVRFDQL